MANGGSVHAAGAPMLPMAMPLPLPMAPSAGHRAGRSGGRWGATGEGADGKSGELQAAGRSGRRHPRRVRRGVEMRMSESVRDEFLRFLNPVLRHRRPARDGAWPLRCISRLTYHVLECINGNITHFTLV